MLRSMMRFFVCVTKLSCACMFMPYVCVRCACVSDEIVVVCFQSFVSIIIAGYIKPTNHFEVIHICFHLK